MKEINLKIIKEFDCFKQSFKFIEDTYHYFDRSKSGFRLNMGDVMVYSNFKKELLIDQMNVLLLEYGLKLDKIVTDIQSLNGYKKSENTYLYFKYINPPKKSPSYLKTCNQYLDQISEILKLPEVYYLQKKSIKAMNLKNRKLIYFFLQIRESEATLPVYDNFEEIETKLKKLFIKILSQYNCTDLKFRITYRNTMEYKNDKGIHLDFKCDFKENL